MMWILCYAISFSTGMIVSSAFISLINSIGIIRNIMVKYETKKYKNVYSFFILIGCLFGSIISYYPNATVVLTDIGKVVCIFIGLFYGIFIGYLALALAEVFDVIPMIDNKMGVRVSIKLLVVTVAVGKFLGSLLYFIAPGFYTY